MKTHGLTKLGWIAVFLAIGSSNPIGIKFAINAGWPIFILGTLRMSVIGLFFFTWCLSLKENLIGPNRQARSQAVIASISKAGSVICLYLALYLIPANRVAIISTFSPIVNLILVHFLLEHEKVRRKHLGGVAISLIGILLLIVFRDGLLEKNTFLRNDMLLGDLLTVTSVFFLQGMIIFEKRALNLGAHPRQLAFSTNLFSVSAFFIFVLISGEKISGIPITAPGISSYLYLITVAGIFLFYYRRWVASKLNVSYINSFSHLGKALTLFYAAIILGEKISFFSLLCFGIILLGTFIATRKETEDKIQYEAIG